MLKRLMNLLYPPKRTSNFDYLGNKADVSNIEVTPSRDIFDDIVSFEKNPVTYNVKATFKDPTIKIIICDAAYLHNHVDNVLKDFQEFILSQFGTNVLITDVSSDGVTPLNPEAREQILTHMKTTVPSLFLQLFNRFMTLRRAKLHEVFNMRTYEYVVNKDGTAGILCLLCGNTSWSKGDVVNKYCGSCYKFHEDFK